MPAPPPHKDRLREERRARYKLGRHAEWIAALALRLRGYRILGRREKTPLGEIDLIAVRGRRLAFIEVKQRARIRRAADLWLAQHTRYQSHELGFDIVFLIGRGWPRHLENGL